MIIVSLLGCSYIWASENEESKGFEVVGVEGKVVYWGPFASSWRAVKVDELIPLGSLVVVKEGAKVTYVTKSKGADQITVSTPLAFRIDGTEVREFSFKQEYIPIHADVTFVQTESVPSDLASAWDRTIFFARSAIRGGAPPETKGPGGEGISATKNLETRFEVDYDKGDIDLIVPKDKSVIVAPKLPHPIRIYWKQKSPPGTLYEVSMWNANDQPKVLGRTKNRSYRAHVPAYGDYIINIKSHSEGEVKASLESVISVVAPAEQVAEEETKINVSGGVEEGPPGSGVGVETSKVRTKALLSPYPPAGMHFVDVELPFSTLISFERSGKADLGATYKIVVRHQSGKLLLEQETVAPEIFMQIETPGYYQWHVEGVLTAGGRWTSATRQFSVNVPKSKPLAQKQGIFYLGQGLSGLAK